MLTLLCSFMPAAHAQSDVVYFPETGHYLRGQFRAFWLANGGVQLFGYPITPEYISSETGLVTQYFERARFELIGQPGTGSVQLGALGREIAVGRIFPKNPPIEDSADRRYVPQTQYVVQYGFKEIWERYGEERIFGFPISNEIDEVLEDGEWHTVQYFERYRFEYWPNFPPGERVLFTNLGRIMAPPSLTPPLPPNAPPEAPVVPPDVPGTTPGAPAPGAPQPAPLPVGSPASLPPLPADVQASITPRSGAPGTVFVFQADGFQPEEEVGIWLTGPEGILRDVDVQVVANARGAIPQGSVRIQTDLSFLPGIWAVNAQGLQSEAMATAYFRLGSGADIIAPPGDPAKLGVMVHDSLATTGNGFVTPVAAPSGTPFLFFADGYFSSDPIDSWVTRPNDQSETIDPIAIQYDQDEGVQVQVTTSGYPAGEYAVAVRGIESGMVNSAAFLITDDYVAGPGTPLPGSVNGSATPLEGGLGVTFQIRGEGLNPTEEVEFWMTEPTGTYTLIRGPHYADEQGNIGYNPPLDIVTTNMFAPGIYGAHFRGKASGVRIDVYFNYIIPGTEPPPPPPPPEPEPEPEPTPAETVEPGPPPEPMPEPEETAEPAPEETAEPAPEETAEPAPEETAEPAPEETAEPAPDETAEPAPEETAEPTPQPTATPAPPTEPAARCPHSPKGSAPNRPVRISLVVKQEETVELWNVTGSEIDLDGWVLCSVNGNEMHTPFGGTLDAGEKKRFTHTAAPIWDDTVRDDAALFNAEGELISYWVDTGSN
jgi:hypothetical protein